MPIIHVAKLIFRTVKEESIMEGMDENRLTDGGSRKIYKKGLEFEDICHKSIDECKQFVREMDYSGILGLSSPKPMVRKSSSCSQLSDCYHDIKGRRSLYFSWSSDQLTPKRSDVPL